MADTDQDPAHQDPDDEAANTQGGPTEQDRDEKSRAAAAASQPVAPKKGRVASAIDRILGHEPTTDEDALVKNFLKLTGYKETDINGVNADRRTVVTKNGGKYLIKKSGKSFRTAAGPAAPSETQKEEDDE